VKEHFDLLRLPMEMQGLKPSILMGKLKQHLPPGVSPDTDLFLAMFLIRLLPSMRETVGTGNHKMATESCGRPVGHSRRPQPHSQVPQHREFGVQLQQSGRRATKGAAKPAPKVALLPALTSIRFTTLAMASVNFTITTLTKLTGVFHPVLGKKNKKPLNLYRFGSTINTLHCHGHAFASGTSPGGIFFLLLGFDTVPKCKARRRAAHTSSEPCCCQFSLCLYRLWKQF
jgi:hypothetical protein